MTRETLEARAVKCVAALSAELLRPVDVDDVFERMKGDRRVDRQRVMKALQNAYYRGKLIYHRGTRPGGYSIPAEPILPRGSYLPKRGRILGNSVWDYARRFGEA